VKWIKHLVDSGDDPDIMDAVNIFGPAGYYVFFRTLELMAREFSVDTPGENIFSIPILRKKFQISFKKVEEILKFFDEKDRIKVKFLNGDKLLSIHLKCEKLKELSDEFTQRNIRSKIGIKSGVTPRTEVEGEVEEDRSASLLHKEDNYVVPVKENIQNFSTPKLDEELENICFVLVRTNIFLGSYAFKNTMVNNGKNKRAILYALTQCFFKKPQKSWAYCLKILKIESGNFCEIEHQKGMK
jgi:hypothetical protein